MSRWGRELELLQIKNETKMKSKNSISQVELAIIDAFRAAQRGITTTKDIEIPWTFTPPGLYPTVHIYARPYRKESIVIKIVESV